MMKSQNKLNILGVIIVFIIIIGSWGLTKYLLYNKEIKLLEGINGFDILSSGETETNNSSLTIEQIREALISLNDNKEIKFHDPTINQLTLDEAVTKAIVDIKYFCEKGILPSSFNSIDNSWNTYAYLGTKAPINVDSKDIYSYWTISFSNGDLLIELKQNAYTGNIWRVTACDFVSENVESVNIEEALKLYSNYLGISMGNYSKSELGYGSLTSEDTRIILSYQSNNLIEKGSVIEINLSPN